MQGSNKGSRRDGPRRLSAMRRSELVAMQQQLEAEAMQSAIVSAKQSIRATHQAERKNFLKRDASVAVGGGSDTGIAVGLGATPSTIASDPFAPPRIGNPAMIPERLLTDPAARQFGAPVVTARVLRVADEVIAATRSRHNRTSSVGVGVAEDDDAAFMAAGGAADGMGHRVAGFDSEEEQIAAVLSVLKRSSAPGSRRSRSEMAILRQWLRSAHPKLFGNLPSKVLDSLVRRIRLAVLRKGQVATLQGYPGHAFYLIAKGSCAVRVASGTTQLRYINRVATEAGLAQSSAVAAVRERAVNAMDAQKSRSATGNSGGGAPPEGSGLAALGPRVPASTFGSNSRRAVAVLDEVCRAPVFAGSIGRAAPAGFSLAQTIVSSPLPEVQQVVAEVGAGAAMSSAALSESILAKIQWQLAQAAATTGGLSGAAAAAAASARIDLLGTPGIESTSNSRIRRSSVASMDSMWSVDLTETRAMEGLGGSSAAANSGAAGGGAWGATESGAMPLRPVLADEGMMGKEVVVLRPGQHFGELALLSDDDRRNATVLAAEDGTALVALARSTYLGSLRERNQREYDERTRFLLSLGLFRGWSKRRVLPVAYSLKRVAIPTGCALYRRGEESTAIYFLKSGSVRLTAYCRLVVLPLRPRTDETGRFTPGLMSRTRRVLSPGSKSEGSGDAFPSGRYEAEQEGAVDDAVTGELGTVAPASSVTHAHAASRLHSVDCVFAGPGTVLGEVEVICGFNAEVVAAMGGEVAHGAADGWGTAGALTHASASGKVRRGKGGAASSAGWSLSHKDSLRPVDMTQGCRRVAGGATECPPRMSTAVAVSDVVAYELSWDQLDALLVQNADSDVSIVLSAMLSDKVWTVRARLVAAKAVLEKRATQTRSAQYAARKLHDIESGSVHAGDFSGVGGPGQAESKNWAERRAGRSSGESVSRRAGVHRERGGEPASPSRSKPSKGDSGRAWLSASGSGSRRQAASPMQTGRAQSIAGPSPAASRVPPLTLPSSPRATDRWSAGWKTPVLDPSALASPERGGLARTGLTTGRHSAAGTVLKTPAWESLHVGQRHAPRPPPHSARGPRSGRQPFHSPMRRTVGSSASAGGRPQTALDVAAEALRRAPLWGGLTGPGLPASCARGVAEQTIRALAERGVASSVLRALGAQEAAEAHAWPVQPGPVAAGQGRGPREFGMRGQGHAGDAMRPGAMVGRVRKQGKLRPPMSPRMPSADSPSSRMSPQMLSAPPRRPMSASLALPGGF